MKVLILGGTRYVGLSLVKKMQSHKKFAKIYTLSRKKKESYAEHSLLDRTDTKALEKIILRLRPNIIIDLICFTKKDGNAILDFKKRGVLSSVKHYIVISTFFVYNYFNLNVYREKKLQLNKQINTIKDSYTKNKVEMELALYSPELLKILSIIRFPYIFSWDDYTNRFQSICEIARTNNEDQLKSNFYFSMISKDSAVDSLIDLSQMKPLGIIDLANPGCLNLTEISHIINSLKSNKDKKKSLFLLPSPYVLERDLCISTKKIPIKKALSQAIKEEATTYFKK